MSEKDKKNKKFALIMWSKKVKDILCYSVQPLETVMNKNQHHNPTIEDEIQERISLSTIDYKTQLGRVLQIGTKSVCNKDASSRVEKFNKTLSKEAKVSSEKGNSGSDEDEERSSKEDKEEMDTGEADNYPKAERNQLSTITNLEKKLEEKEIEITQLRKANQDMEGKLKNKDEKINALITKNIFLQNTLPSKFAEMAQGSPKKRRVGENIADWNNPEVVDALEKLNLTTKEKRELKSKTKSSLLARACLAYCFPIDILAKSVVKGGNQQKSKDDSK
ncbi:uncharacterized protein LOC124316299 [Daphnia pulicaria]|uniref:uncharacterized protein LOC124316299 n=1 Tax=Daphnia pulicaria TaxID=35523 RepID=UPI001EEB3EBA|nr:uncharacterized protein LOC124316299 [Daphnia pulicaria]